MLDELTELTHYHRSYAAYLLRHQGSKIRLGPHKTLVGEIGKRVPRRSARVYGEPELKALRLIWVILDGICGRRLAAALPEVIPVLERHREIRLEAQVREKLPRISPATIDRLLGPERKRLQLRRRSGTPPGHAVEASDSHQDLRPMGGKSGQVLAIKLESNPAPEHRPTFQLPFLFVAQREHGINHSSPSRRKISG